jgi:hypothetical protein
MMTISLDTVEPFDPRNPSEQEVISVPFTKYSIPDFHTGKSAVEIVQDLREWLAPNGEAHRLLHAQVLHKQMEDRLYTEMLDVSSLFGAKRGESVRVPITLENTVDTGKKGWFGRDTRRVGGKDLLQQMATNPERVGASIALNQDVLDELLADQSSELSPVMQSLARIQYIKTWLGERNTMLKHVAAGGDISAEDLRWLSSRRLASRNVDQPEDQKLLDRTVLQQTIRDLQTSLSPLRQKILSGDIPGTLRFYIDPKEDGPLEFVAEREGREPVRIPLSQVPLQIDAMLEAFNR